MDLEKWADDILRRFPTGTNVGQQDEWYGVENAVDVMAIAIAVKQLQAELKTAKKIVEQVKRLRNHYETIGFTQTAKKIEQALKNKP